ncbi:hypothetical protein KHA96_08700 [Bacillus sp. FJAT-49711]|uniref:hypothetical protein n=1 Tax=Bacillus sp. FJAT-49711 TaxID=2833585 RepID=UPI001BC9D893|nr:hypothetical protein [Bacillus sp. FJAT-49711]MBS4218389.1 hypothetical protein [Bacillus sp. FJAT-49711]
MRRNKLLLILMLVISWLSLLSFGKSSFKRFLPVGLFSVFLTRLENGIAHKRAWWWWYEKLHPKLSGSFPFVWGPFMVGSMWILKFTYGKIFRYLIINVIIDSFFTYFLIDKWLTKFGIASLVRMKKIQLSLLLFFDSLLLYGFQFFAEKIRGHKSR